MKYFVCFLFFIICNLGFTQTNQPPIVFASGNQAYCPLTQAPIVTNFTITDADNTGVDAFYIQISSGYQANSDQLILTGSHPTINSSFNSSEGKLTLTGIGGGEILLSNLEAAVRDVVFESSSANPNSEKIFSLTVGDANYLAQTDHYYEFVSSSNITWTDARNQAASRTYYGLQGYLVTITSPEEAQLVGEQATGTGWIGGSDEETEGVWKWVTGPEAGTVFWNGEINGSSPNFAFWNVNEPNNYTGNVPTGEHYAHITDPSIGMVGAWNDLPNIGGTGLYIPRGYVVEYGGTPGDPVVNISASTRIYLPEITTFTNAQVCNSGSVTLSAIASTGTVLWFDSDLGGNIVGTGNNFTTPNLTSTTTYYAAVSINGCITSPRTEVTATINPIPTITNVEGDQLCGAGTATLNATASAGILVWYDTATSSIPIFTGNNFQVSVTATSTFYVRAVDAGCTSVRVTVEVLVDLTLPSFSVDTNVTLCLDKQFVDIEATNPIGANYSYLWEDENGNTISEIESARLTDVGKYFVTAISMAGCKLTKEVNVSSSEIANITLDSFIISDDTSNNSIAILSDQLGIGDYSFSLDNSNGFYTSQIFYENLSVGLHKLYIKDNNGCGTKEFEFIVLNYPNFFTPNGDPHNQNWTLEGFEKSFFTISEVIIFNRFGKILKRLDTNNLIWDGTYNGAKVLSATYWFKASLLDINGRRIEKTGSFSLLRK